jgi:hypothetical protein
MLNGWLVDAFCSDTNAHTTADQRQHCPSCSSALHRAEKILCVLRDGRKLIGYLRSIDQFGECFCEATACASC